MRVRLEIRKLKTFNFYAIICLILIFFVLTVNNTCNYIDPLTQEEREWLSKHDGRIRLTNAPDWPPTAFVDSNKIFKGISPDYMRLIEKKLNFKFKILHHKTWKEMLQDAIDKKVDVVGAIQKTPNRSKHLIFTEPFLKIPNVIVVRKEVKGTFDLERLKDMKIAIGEGFAVEEYIKKNYSFLDIITVLDDYSLLKKVVNKEADAMISDLPTVSFFIKKHNIMDVRVAGDTNYDLELRIASRNDWPILIRIVEKGLALITQEEKDVIHKKWMKVE